MLLDRVNLSGCIKECELYSRRKATGQVTGHVTGQDTGQVTGHVDNQKRDQELVEKLIDYCEIVDVPGELFLCCLNRQLVTDEFVEYNFYFLSKTSLAG